METIDVLVRVGAATLFGVTALLLLRRAPREAGAWVFALFAAGVCGFLARNTPDPQLQLTGTAAAVASFLSGNAAVFLWWFVLSLFEDDFRLDPPRIAISVAWFVLAALDRGLLGAGFQDIGLTWGLVALGLIMVASLMARLLTELEGDLVENRRAARVWVAGALAALLLVDLGFDIRFGFDWKPWGFTLAQNLVILAVIGALAWRVLDARPGALRFQSAEEPAPAVEAVTVAAPTTPAERRLLERLTRLMEVDQAWRDPDLTFAGFVRMMGAPEAEVRRLVNRRLGHRHFRSFLNHYRVAEVRRVLADPERVGEKLVSVALDAGFASLASFNRAFKAVENRPPSDFRQAAGRAGSPQSVF